jgi:hypothetical protein
MKRHLPEPYFSTPARSASSSSTDHCGKRGVGEVSTCWTCRGRRFVAVGCRGEWGGGGREERLDARAYTPIPHSWTYLGLRSAHRVTAKARRVGLVQGPRRQCRRVSTRVQINLPKTAGSDEKVVEESRLSPTLLMTRGRSPHAVARGLCVRRRFCCVSRSRLGFRV